MKENKIEKKPTTEPMEQSHVEKILSELPEVERDNLRAILEKYRRGDAPKWQEEKLRAAGLIEPGPSDGEEGDDLTDCTSNRELADRLTRHFEGRISIEISPPALSQWRRGRGLAQGTPLPPARSNNRHKTREWADWITKNMLPKYGVSGGRAETEESRIFQKAAVAKAQREIDEAAIARLDRQVAEGTYQSAEMFRSHLRWAGTTANQAITTNLERIVVEKLLGVTASWNLSQEQQMKIQQSLQKAAQEAADDVRKAVRKAFDEAEEKTE